MRQTSSSAGVGSSPMLVDKSLATLKKSDTLEMVLVPCMKKSVMISLPDWLMPVDGGPIQNLLSDCRARHDEV